MLFVLCQRPQDITQEVVNITYYKSDNIPLPNFLYDYAITVQYLSFKHVLTCIEHDMDSFKLRQTFEWHIKSFLASLGMKYLIYKEINRQKDLGCAIYRTCLI